MNVGYSNAVAPTKCGVFHDACALPAAVRAFHDDAFYGARRYLAGTFAARLGVFHDACARAAFVAARAGGVFHDIPGWGCVFHDAHHCRIVAAFPAGLSWLTLLHILDYLANSRRD